MSIALPSITIKVEAPEGTIYINVVEDDGRPVSFQLYGGKTGNAVPTLLSSYAEMMTELLPLKGIHGIIQILHKQKSGRPPAMNDGFKITSIPEAIAYGLLLYQRMKWDEYKSILGGLTEGFSWE